MPAINRRALMISSGWMQAAAIVLIFGFFIMGVLTYYTYNDEPPIPEVVKSANGSILFTRADIMAGQQIFLRNGIMEYGSIFGHGAYLGPDFTAEYLHRAALSSIDFYGGANSDTARSRTIRDFKTNRYDKATGTLVYTDAQMHAFDECKAYYASFFGEPTTKFGLRPNAIRDAEEIRELTAFFSWSAWAASAARPGHSYSYTNNWPPEPLVDNHATADSIVWSVLSLVALLGGIGLLLAAFGRWNLLGWHGREQQSISFRAPDEVSLTPTQNVCAWFFFIMAALFVVQTLLGGATEHYRADLQTFFGIDLGRLFLSTSSGLGTCSCPSSGSHFFSCGRYFPGSDDCRPGAAGTKVAGLWFAGRAGHRGCRKSPRGVCGNPGLDPQCRGSAIRDLNISISGVSGKSC